MTDKYESRNLLFTERGRKWLKQFASVDSELAEKLVSSLTLVSHNEFERNLTALIEIRAEEIEGPVALFAVREIDHEVSFFDQAASDEANQVQALSKGADHGSEARISAIVRNLSKAKPGKYLNHPDVAQMRNKKCRSILFVDDFIGSGSRVRDFLQSFWLEPTITSWHSFKYLDFSVVVYSGTEDGIKSALRHKSKPSVHFHRGCPTFHDMPWSRDAKRKILNLCKKYGLPTSQGYWWDGFGRAMAAIVFEHGCPDNTPVILWAPDEAGKPWTPLFIDRVVGLAEGSVFPPEIVHNDLVTVLLDVGQPKLAKSGMLERRGQVGQSILLILALVAKGQRKQIALSYATGLSEEDCSRIIEKCIKWKFITRSRKLTKRGLAELNAAKKSRVIKSDHLDAGSDYYYPRQLRGATHG